MTGEIKYVSVKRWEEYQHYQSGRNSDPGWIKLYSKLLNDFEFVQLPDEYKLTLVMVWLYASKVDNKIPLIDTFVLPKLGVHNPVSLQTLMDDGWLILYPSPKREEKKRKEKKRREADKYTRQEYPEDFRNYFYDAYPRHEAVADAAKAWGQTEEIRPDNDTLLKAVKAYSKAVDGRERRHVKLPATWLRGEGWADYVIDGKQSEGSEEVLRRSAHHASDKYYNLYKDAVRQHGYRGSFEDWKAR